VIRGALFEKTAPLDPPQKLFISADPFGSGKALNRMGLRWRKGRGKFFFIFLTGATFYCFFASYRVKKKLKEVL
jgi:hypothetical protein